MKKLLRQLRIAAILDSARAYPYFCSTEQVPVGQYIRRFVRDPNDLEIIRTLKSDEINHRQ